MRHVRVGRQGGPTAWLLAVVIAGCAAGDPPLPQAVNSVGADDPRAEGQRLFFLDAWGTEVLGDWPPVEFLLSLAVTEPALFGGQLAAYGFLPDPNDDLPIGLKRGLVDPSRPRETCAMCHVGRLPDGSLHLGSPNLALDIGRFRADLNDRWVAAGHPPLMNALAAKKARELGPGRIDADTGDYPFAVPADFPPYFTLGRRTHLNYIGTGGDLRTEVSFSIYSSGAGAPNPETAKVPFPTEARLQAFLAFFGTLEPPTPPAQDAALVERGRAVFDAARCGACHHPDRLEDDGVVPVRPDGTEAVPGDDPAWPRGAIGTDPTHRALIDGAAAPDSGGTGSDTGYLDLLRFAADHALKIQITDGYRVNDLRGLWNTAPYLHNGSVPTLEDLLRPPAARPRTFLRGAFTVDTAVPGNGNQGHAFGTELPAADKAALVAFLKSL